MRIEIDIEIPEGYEKAHGKQPRKARRGDWCIHLCSTEPFEHKCLVDSAGKLIILKKKAPEYFVTDLYGRGEEAVIKMVSINALEDAMSIITNIHGTDQAKYDTLKELL